MSKQTEPKKSPSAGGGAAPSKPSVPTASGGAISSGKNDAPPRESNPESGSPAPGATSPLDEKTRKAAAAHFEGIDPDHIWGYCEYPDKYVIVVMDGVTTQKFEAAKPQ